MTTPEALAALQQEGAPLFLLDFVRWAGPRLEPLSEPEAFFITFQLALSELAVGKAHDGRPLSGSLVRKPLRLYAGLARLAPFVARAFRGPAFGQDVERARVRLTTEV